MFDNVLVTGIYIEKYSNLYHLTDSNMKPKIAFVDIVPRNTTGKIPKKKKKT